MNPIRNQRGIFLLYHSFSRGKLSRSQELGEWSFTHDQRAIVSVSLFPNCSGNQNNTWKYTFLKKDAKISSPLFSSLSHLPFLLFCIPCKNSLWLLERINCDTVSSTPPSWVEISFWMLQVIRLAERMHIYLLKVLYKSIPCFWIQVNRITLKHNQQLQQP